MNIVCTYCGEFKTGGTETYWIRMAEWAKKNNVRFNLALEKQRSSIRDYWKKILIQLDVSVLWYNYSATKGISIDNEQFGIENCTIIAHDIQAYVGFRIWKMKKKKEDVNVLLYILHPDFILASAKYPFLNLPYRRITKEHLGDSIIFMDKDCLSRAEEIFRAKIPETCIFNVGYNIDPFDESIVNKRSKHRHPFKILSVSRFDFPFKGYQLGLLDIMPELTKRYPDLYLTIIGCDERNLADNGNKKFQDKLNALDDTVKKRIRWEKRVNYKELRDYCLEATIYIGMGSTILDSAKTGLPSIVVAYNTNIIEPVGFFHECSDCIGAVSVPGRINGDIFQMLNLVYEMSEEEYTLLQIKTFEEYAKKYNIDNIMNALIHRQSHDVHVGLHVSIYNKVLSKAKRWFL